MKIKERSRLNLIMFSLYYLFILWFCVFVLYLDSRWLVGLSVIHSFVRCLFHSFNLIAQRLTQKMMLQYFFPLLCSWPRNGCCSWDDSHTYEIKHRGTTPPRVFVPLGILSRRIPCPVFDVIDPFSCVWRSLAPSGVNKMSALLFWTKWLSRLKISFDKF